MGRRAECGAAEAPRAHASRATVFESQQAAATLREAFVCDVFRAPALAFVVVGAARRLLSMLKPRRQPRTGLGLAYEPGGPLAPPPAARRAKGRDARDGDASLHAIQCSHAERGIRAPSRGGASMNDVLWVLVVIAFWLIMFTIVMVGVRYVSHEHDDEETVGAVDDGAYHHDDRVAAT